MSPPTKPNRLHETAAATAKLTFDDNALALQLFGPHNENLKRVERALGVSLQDVGNEVTVLGESAVVKTATGVLTGLYARLEDGREIDAQEVDAALRMVANGDMDAADLDVSIKTRKRVISPRSPAQAAYLKAIDDNVLVFSLGPAGTGKTYLAVAKAVERLLRGDVDRIILSRPAVEAGEQLGFLPGDMREKVDPYLRPLYDALHDMMPSEQVAKCLESGDIEVAPLAFMRGRTLANAFVILDEAQNTTAVQMKMFLTRLGENARMVVTGDLSQVDLPRGIRSGLRDALDVLGHIEGVGVSYFDDRDVVRHHLVGKIVKAYDANDARRKAGARYESEADG
jgi:phosphate starvation-inducible PhoH-like protein